MIGRSWLISNVASFYIARPDDVGNVVAALMEKRRSADGQMGCWQNQIWQRMGKTDAGRATVRAFAGLEAAAAHRDRVMITGACAGSGEEEAGGAISLLPAGDEGDIVGSRWVYTPRLVAYLLDGSDQSIGTLPKNPSLVAMAAGLRRMMKH
ncbi:hypothetical protein ACLOJK_023241 [Asimina triloba]